jgi:RsiW-degrading membrane proteinase PrsW (M82 family)
VVGWLRNFTVRRMSTTTQRAIEVLVGLAIAGYCVYEVYTGRALGKFRSYDRHEEPFWFWTSIVFTLAIAAAFLFGFTAWRK